MLNSLIQIDRRRKKILKILICANYPRNLFGFVEIMATKEYTLAEDTIVEIRDR